MSVNELPQYTIPLIGKLAEISFVSARLQTPECRLLTLVGSGGIGKTRLAVEVLEQVASNFSDGVYFVELQPLSSTHNIAQSIATALKVELNDGNDLERKLLTHLHRKNLLLVLDNFEHLLPAREFVRLLLDQSSGLKILVTSRERLRLREEWIYQVDSLTYPSAFTDNDLETYEAVKLFVEHARQLRHDFSLSAEMLGVERICRLTEGIPLAIELAAAWTRTLYCDEIADELQQAFDILETDLHDVSDRHRSMRAVFDRSWRLLNDVEQKTMLGISVFRGGFRRDAAEQVVGTSLHDLSALVEKSLLRLNQNGRYTIHELQLQYVREQLDHSPQQKERLQDRHCKYYLSLMNQPELDFDEHHFTSTLHVIDADVDNIRAAWAWAIENRRISDLIDGMKGLYLYAWSRNWYMEANQAYQNVINTLRGDPQTADTQLALAVSLSLNVMLDIWSGRRQQNRRQNLEESVSILRHLDARPELTIAVGGLGWHLLQAGELRAAEHLLEEAKLLAQETDNIQFQSFVIWLLGNLAVQHNQAVVAEERYREALEFGRVIKDHRAIVFSLRSLGDLDFEQGNYAQARLYYQESLDVARDLDTSVIIVEIRNRLGQHALATGALTLAVNDMQQALALAEQCGEPTIMSSSKTLGDILLAQGLYEDARHYYEQAHRIAVDLDNPEAEAAVQAGLGHLALSIGDMDTAKAHFTRSQDYYRDVGNHPDETAVFVALSVIAVTEGNYTKTRSHLLSALRQATDTDRPPLMLQSIGAAAQYYMRQGNLSRAVELASLVMSHPASHHTTKTRAHEVLTQAEVELFSTELETAALQSMRADLHDVCSQLVESLVAQEDQPLADPLSQRELEVLSLVATGRSNREIAQDLTVSLGTVKSHMHNILQKLDVGNRTEAVARARDLRLL